MLPKRVDTLVLNNILQYFVLETFSVSRVILLKSWIWIIPPWIVASLMTWQSILQKKISVSLLVWSVIRKSRVEALIQENLWTSASRIIKNYEQLSRTISKFQALFQNFEHYFFKSTFLRHVLSSFWLVSSSATGTCLATRFILLLGQKSDRDQTKKTIWRITYLLIGIYYIITSMLYIELKVYLGYKINP